MSFQFDHLLAVDASTESLHLAASFGDDRLVKSSDELGRRHGQLLFRKIEQVLESSGIDQNALSGIIVCTGPGSFTGIRVALAAMKGIALVRRIPIIGISLFELLAARHADNPEPQLAVVRLTRDEFASVQFASGKVELSSLRTGSPRQLFSQEIAQQIWLINLPGNADQPLPPQIRHFEYDASDLLMHGRWLLEQGISHDLHTLEPMYLLASTAERNWELRQQSR